MEMMKTNMKYATKNKKLWVVFVILILLVHIIILMVIDKAVTYKYDKSNDNIKPVIDIQQQGEPARSVKKLKKYLKNKILVYSNMYTNNYFKEWTDRKHYDNKYAITAREKLFFLKVLKL